MVFWIMAVDSKFLAGRFQLNSGPDWRHNGFVQPNSKTRIMPPYVRAAHFRESFATDFTAEPVATKRIAPRISRITRIRKWPFNPDSESGQKRKDAKTEEPHCSAIVRDRANPTKLLPQRTQRTQRQELMVVLLCDLCVLCGQFVFGCGSPRCAFAPLRLCVKGRKAHSGKPRSFASSLRHPPTSLWSRLCRAALSPRFLRRGNSFLAALGFCCGGGLLHAAEITPATVLKAMEQVADWQLANPSA
ncbi:MAG TPA: hypothetical protein VN765_00355, partial [Candidatus Acidoferrum sp.]|nr:hypothetical protein [Candidatus Acidoferrum sp.]